MKTFEAEMCWKVTGFVESEFTRIDYRCHVCYGASSYDLKLFDSPFLIEPDNPEFHTDTVYAQAVVWHYFRDLNFRNKPFEFEEVEITSLDSAPKDAPIIETDKHKLWVSEGSRKK